MDGWMNGWDYQCQCQVKTLMIAAVLKKNSPTIPHEEEIKKRSGRKQIPLKRRGRKGQLLTTRGMTNSQVTLHVASVNLEQREFIETFAPSYFAQPKPNRLIKKKYHPNMQIKCFHARMALTNG